MGAMNDIELDRILAERMDEHKAWNEGLSASSKGARERANTTYDILSGPASKRRLGRLRRAGVKEKYLPETSIHIRLHPGTPRYNRQQRKRHASW